MFTNLCHVAFICLVCFVCSSEEKALFKLEITPQFQKFKDEIQRLYVDENFQAIKVRAQGKTCFGSVSIFLVPPAWFFPCAPSMSVTFLLALPVLAVEPKREETAASSSAGGWGNRRSSAHSVARRWHYCRLMPASFLTE